ncbi:MAG: hypothetical protein K2P78_05550 [Gemmataceae bacterium]|nr:hypothetical protein [Gemmataceae bacterium]
MSPNDILYFTRKKPFQPFRIEVSDGSSYEVRHPEFCMVLQTSVIIGLTEPAGTIPPDRVEWIDARHIVKLIPLGGQAVGGNNGPQTNGTPGS